MILIWEKDGEWKSNVAAKLNDLSSVSPEKVLSKHYEIKQS